MMLVIASLLVRPHRTPSSLAYSRNSSLEKHHKDRLEAGTMCCVSSFSIVYRDDFNAAFAAFRRTCVSPSLCFGLRIFMPHSLHRGAGLETRPKAPAPTPHRSPA